MKNFILQKIETLPPLPKTVLEIEQLKKSDDADNDKLINIIQSDPMIVANVLKVANSSMYGFSSQIKNLKMAINMLGFNMVCNIAITTAVYNSFKPNLDAYGVYINYFSKVSSTQSLIIEKWSEPSIIRFKKDLQLAAFLQEVGKILVSMIVVEAEKTKDFLILLQENEDINEVEKKFVGYTSAELSALIFSHWNFNQSIVNFIKSSETLSDEVDDDLKKGGYALKISKTLSPVVGQSFTTENILKATEFVKEIGFNEDKFERMIQCFTSGLKNPYDLS